MANQIVVVRNQNVFSVQKLIGAFVIFVSAISYIFPAPYNLDVVTVSLALSGAATFYFGTQIVPAPPSPLPPVVPPAVPSVSGSGANL